MDCTKQKHVFPYHTFNKCTGYHLASINDETGDSIKHDITQKMCCRYSAMFTVVQITEHCVLFQSLKKILIYDTDLTTVNT